MPKKELVTFIVIDIKYSAKYFSTTTTALNYSFIFSFDDQHVSLMSEKSTLEDVRIISLEGQVALQKIELEKLSSNLEEHR